jgi:pilus assembly protein CpaB
VLCIILSLAICFGLAPLLTRSASETTTIVRVAAPIQSGDEIAGRMVETLKVGAYNLPFGVITDKDEVVGKYATADLAVGDLILPSKLSDEPAAENAYLYNLDGTKQAMSLTIKSFATGLSGKLKSGDVVSVYVADYEGRGEAVVPAELQFVEIVSVTAASGDDANTGSATDERELPSTVTFLVTVEQAKVLSKLEQDSEVHLALVYRGDSANAAKFIEAQDALIAQLYAEPEGIENTEETETEVPEP